MRNIKIILQYDGTNYNGWQIQRKEKILRQGIITIQGVIQDAIKRITREDVNVIAAGRTDAGVHAIEQVASFKTSSNLSKDVLKRALNAILPYDIRVIDLSDVSMDFHPRYNARSKIYFYMISNTSTGSPFLYRYLWTVGYSLNIDAMIECLRFFKGSHDFASFRASGCSSKSSVRTIIDISIEEADTIFFMNASFKGRFLKIRVEADAFLRHMVRNIVGTIIEVGKGRMKPDEIEDILFLKDRRFAGPTAPPQGLFLERVNY